MGIGLEIAQLAVPQRSSDIADALADLAGVATVLLPILVCPLRLVRNAMRVGVSLELIHFLSAAGPC
jgi:VanZ family protein